MSIRELEEFQIIPRLMMVAMIFMTYRVVEWFMTLPAPSLEQTGLLKTGCWKSHKPLNHAVCHKYHRDHHQSRNDLKFF